MQFHVPDEIALYKAALAVECDAALNADLAIWDEASGDGLDIEQ